MPLNYAFCCVGLLCVASTAASVWSLSATLNTTPALVVADVAAAATAEPADATAGRQALAAKVAVLQARLNGLQDELRQFSDRQQALAGQVDVALNRPESADAISSTPLDDLDELIDPTALLEAELEKQRQVEQQTRLRLDQQLQPNSSAAELSEQAFAALADDLDYQGADGSELTDAVCQTQLCRFELHHDSDDASSQFAALMTALPTFANTEGVMYRDAYDDGTVSTTIYVAQPGYRLPE